MMQDRKPPIALGFLSTSRRVHDDADGFERPSNLATGQLSGRFSAGEVSAWSRRAVGDLLGRAGDTRCLTAAAAIDDNDDDSAPHQSSLQ